MRTVKFADLIREAAKVNREADVWVPEGARTMRSWPLCMTCRKEVDAAELKNFTMTSVEVWAKCHNQEDFYKVFFPFRIDGDPMEDERANWAIKRALHDGIFFDPKAINETQKRNEPALIVLPRAPALAKGTPGLIL